MRKAIHRILVLVRVIMILWFIPEILTAQDLIPPGIESSLEELEERSVSPGIHPEWTEDIISLRDDPVNLNNTTKEELLRIPGMSIMQADAILNYLMNYGEFLSIYELRSVTGFDSLSVVRILPFITTGPGPESHSLKLKKILREGHGRLLANYQQLLQKQQGYLVADSVLMENPEAGYGGSPQKYSIRFEYNYWDRLSAGLGGLKGAGEKVSSSDIYGFIRLKKIGFLKDLIIGSFRADFGQGLVIGSGAGYGSAAGSPELMRCAGGIRPSLSSGETSGFKGMAAKLVPGKIFVSIIFSGINSSARSRELACGTNINWSNRFMSAGITGIYSRYGTQGKAWTEVYRLYSFNGRENLNLGVDFRIVAGDIYFLGEAGRSMNGGIAWLAGMQFIPDPSSSVSLLYRNYQPAYQNPFSSAAGRNAPNTNERGILVKANIQVAKWLTLRGYADLFSFPWLKYRIDLSSRGDEWIVEGTVLPCRNTTMEVRFRSIASQINETGEGSILRKWNRCRNYSIRCRLNWQVTPVFLLRTRFDIVETHSEIEPARHGYLFCQDFVYKPLRIPLAFYIRYAMFDTDTWDERIYVYEPDVLYGYSVPVLDGEGLRCCAMMTWKVSRRIDLTFRYAQTWYAGRQTIGSGLTEISGNVKSEVKVQGKIRF